MDPSITSSRPDPRPGPRPGPRPDSRIAAGPLVLADAVSASTVPAITDPAEIQFALLDDTPLPPRRPRTVTTATWVLFGGLLLAGGFAAGAKVGRDHAPTSSAAAGTRAGGFGAAAAGVGVAGTGTAGAAAAGAGTANAAGRTANAGAAGQAGNTANTAAGAAQPAGAAASPAGAATGGGFGGGGDRKSVV